MPFKSKKQMQKFAQLVKEGKMKREVFENTLKETPNHKALPEKAVPTGIDRIREIGKVKIK